MEEAGGSLHHLWDVLYRQTRTSSYISIRESKPSTRIKPLQTTHAIDQGIVSQYLCAGAAVRCSAISDGFERRAVCGITGAIWEEDQDGAGGPLLGCLVRLLLLCKWGKGKREKAETGVGRWELC